MAARFQALTILAFAVAASLAPLTLAQARIAEERAKLSAEANRIVESLVRKPYGWAVAAAAAGAGEEGGPLPRNSARVSFEPQHTPAIALLLHRASRLLDDNKLQDAARQMARGLAAAQEPSGRIPSYALFSTSATTRDRGATVPERASTIAALAALWHVADPENPADEPLRRSAARCATWLMRQQTASGAWPAALPDTSPPLRLIRLDTREYRDATFAMLFAADALADHRMKLAAERSVEQLLKLRPEKSRTVGGLWQGAYELSGASAARLEHGDAIDMIASRHAAETLLAVTILSPRTEFAKALQEAHGAFRLLAYDNNLWDRYYPLVNGEARRRGNLPPEEPEGLLAKPDAALRAADFGVPPILAAIDAITEQGLDLFIRNINSNHEFRWMLALGMCGFEIRWQSNDPMDTTLDPRKSSHRLYALIDAFERGK